MPVSSKTVNLKYKNSRGQYVGVNTVGETTTAEQIAAIEAKGEEVLESIPADYSELTAEVDGKANKVSGAVNNNFAMLDGNGNLKDSGHKHSDYLTAHQDISGKADKVESAAGGNFAGLDADGNLVDSGHKHSDYLTGGDVAGAVSEWLNEHPETTTIVEDGSITNAKLHTSLQNRININATDSLDTFHPQNTITGLIVNGSSSAFNPVYLADRKNYIPDYPLSTAEQGGLTVSFNGRFIELTGEATGDYIYRTSPEWMDVDIPSGSYKIIAYYTCTGSFTVGPDAPFVMLSCRDANGTETLIRNCYYAPSSSTSRTWDVTLSGNVKKFAVLFAANSGISVTGTLRFWFGLYPADVTVTNTETTVSSGESASIAIVPANYPNGVDTVQHASIATYHPNIQDYIDNMQIDINEELTYVTPERFGAKGNNAADDTAALQNCISYAIRNNKVVRGFGTYRTSSPVTMDADNMDVELYKINYTGNSYAFRIGGRWNTFRFNEISAESSGGGCIELFSSSQSHHDTNRNMITGNSLIANGCCVYAAASIGYYILYNVLNIKSMNSAASDCIRTAGHVGELAVYNTWFRCPSGWCFKGEAVKLFNCTLESNCYGGVNSTIATIQNCRARELMDTLMSGNPKYGISSGILFKAQSGASLCNVVINIDDFVYYDAIDLSDVVPLTGGTSGASTVNGLIGSVNSAVIYGDLNYRYGNWVLGSRMVLHGKDRICVPQQKSVFTIDNADFDLRDETYTSGTFVKNRPVYPTKFIINVSGCVIHLAPSYCAEGYSDFVADMSNFMATIYDRRGNVIFDPEEHTAGVYRFTALVDHTADDVYQMTHQNNNPYPINSGYCDVWEVEKIG